MPLLTKKFTRDSLRRANGGGVSVPNESEEQAKAEMIRREMALARAKSMRSRNALDQQHRRHRSLSRGPSSSYRPIGAEIANAKTDSGQPKPTKLAHPNDEYSQAFSEAELLTQMSSLTEPTWAPSVVGGSDINSAHHRQNHQNQRSRTANYNNIRHQKSFQNNNARVHKSRGTSTISTVKDQKDTKVLLFDDRVERRTTFGNDKSNTNRGNHERAFVGIEGLEVRRVEQNERKEDDRDDKTIGSSTKHLSKDMETSAMRDDAPEDELLLSTSRNRRSLPSRRSKIRGTDDESNASRTRGRSGRPSGKRKSKKRSSSISSQRSAQSTRTASTTPTISKHSSTSSSISSSLASRKSKTSTTMPTRRRTNGEKDKSSTILRSSSVPPSSSNSKRSQRTSSVPPKTFNMSEMERNNRYGDVLGRNRGSKNITEPDKNATDVTLNTASTMADLTTASSQSNVHSKVSFAASSDSSFTPSSSIEAARMSLRPRLRRSNSNRSISSMQSESVISITSNRRETSRERAREKTRMSFPDDESQTLEVTQEIHRKRDRETKQRRRHELETKQERRQRKEEKRRQQKEARVASLAPEEDGDEPYPTTTSTLLIDFLVFHLLLLLTLPQRVVLNLWSRVFSKKWTARRRNVLVTGANSALGSETARQFATEGANLILVSHSTASSANGLTSLVNECHELGCGEIKCYSADPSNAVSTELTLRQAAKDFDDRFDVVILNGETKSHGCLFEEIVDVHQIEKMVTENTLGCIMALHYSLKHIPKSSDSRIVILSSTSGVIASPYRSVYGATQHALKGFCDSIRMELNETYTERRSPKICFASFPELVGQNIQNRGRLDHRMSRMGTDIAPMKTRTWAGIPLQQAAHALVGAIASGERDFGAPRYVNTW
eukprot:CAMPEP_0116094336 /NCGR_PEP_ID=MMETSP0327-20121206/9076_1 /TAXON_ID=44447 /ORGANISM="Pseudo-nitzschia delicatissima, Strain B596" /LENGTH=893 /DNA_ID=CAMNT_0003585931 /DNA_START=82 /DNA_END=2760 /DNA_ORIENTATION=+